MSRCISKCPKRIGHRHILCSDIRYVQSVFPLDKNKTMELNQAKISIFFCFVFKSTAKKSSSKLETNDTGDGWSLTKTVLTTTKKFNLIFLDND